MSKGAGLTRAFTRSFKPAPQVAGFRYFTTFNMATGASPKW